MKLQSSHPLENRGTAEQPAIATPECDINISIGMPMFRDDAAGNFAVESALSQPDSVSQIIISDNNLQRDPETVRRWSRDSRVRYINSGHNIGSLGNFIRCWEEATERYFLWLGDDDFLHPSFGKSIQKRIQKSDSNVIAWSPLPSKHLCDQGTLISGSRFRSIDAASPAQRLRQVNSWRSWNYFFYSVYDRQALSIDNLKYFHENWNSYIGNFDWAWTYAVSMSGAMSLVPEQLYFYCDDNWSDLGDWNQRETRNFSAFLKPDVSESDSEILRRLNGALLAVLYLARHCLANKTAAACESAPQQPRANQDLAAAVSNACFSRLKAVLLDANSPLVNRIHDIFAKRTGQSFVLELVDLLNSQLREQHGITNVASTILQGIGDSPAIINDLNQGDQKSQVTTLPSLIKGITAPILKSRRVRDGLSFIHRRILPKKKTRTIFLPLQD